MSDALDKLELAIEAAEGHNAGQWADALRPFMRSGGITSSRRIAAFVGQVSVESAGFARLEENLWYSAERLVQVWPSRFPTITDALPYSMHPRRLANHVYANRLGNGDEESGDGWQFRGSGLIQLTGRSNHEAFALDTKNASGDYLRTPPGAAQGAVWFWNRHKLNTLADGWQITNITKVVNGGTNGLHRRIELSNRALTVLDL